MECITIKAPSAPHLQVIDCLQQARIRCGMVTGDHLRTAVSVAHQCNILPEGKAVALIDGGGEAGGVSLSVLYPDGSVLQNAQRGLIMSQVREGVEG